MRVLGILLGVGIFISIYFVRKGVWQHALRHVPAVFTAVFACTLLTVIQRNYVAMNGTQIRYQVLFFPPDDGELAY
jgi:uncharacterized BrkB/YihY/UPF0761 family membrane protein